MVVLAAILFFSTLVDTSVFFGRIEEGLPVVLGLPTVFTQSMKMVPNYLDVVVPLLSLMHPVRCDKTNTQMEFCCDEGRTLRYHQTFQIFLC